MWNMKFLMYRYRLEPLEYYKVLKKNLKATPGKLSFGSLQQVAHHTQYESTAV